MASEYPRTALGSVAHIVMGQSPPGSTYNEVGDGLPFYQGVADFGTRHPSPRIYCSEPTRIAEPGNILFSVRAPIGRVNIAIERCSIGRGLAVIRLYDAQDRTFIECILKSMSDQWGIFEGGGSVFGNARKEDLSTLEIIWPDPGVRHAIAHILGTLDDKIELNRRANQTLEVMTQALFKSWFVDFEPFRAQDLQESKLGLIPAEWKVEPLGYHFDVVRGLSHKGEYLSNSGMPLHNLNSVYEGGGYKYEGIKFYEGEYQDRHIVVPGDVIVTNTEQGFDFLLIGYPAIVPKCFGPIGIFSHHLFRLRKLDNSPLTTHFIYLLLKNRTYHDIVAGYTNGTTINMLQREDLNRLPTIIPPEEISAKFDELTFPMIEKNEQGYDESSLLSTLRNTLLPRLLSGKMRVRDAEKLIEKAI